MAYASCCIELPNEIEAAFKDAADTCLTERSDVAGPIILGTILRSFDRSDCPSDEDVEEVMKAFPEATCMAKKAGWMTADGKLQLETIEADVFDFLQNTDEGFLDVRISNNFIFTMSYALRYFFSKHIVTSKHL